MLALAYELRTAGMTGRERDDFDSWLLIGWEPPPAPADGEAPQLTVVPAPSPVPLPVERAPVADLDEMRRTWGKGPQAAAGLAMLIGGGGSGE